MEVGTRQVAGHSCDGWYGVDKNVWNAKLADTSKGDDSDDTEGTADGQGRRENLRGPGLNYIWGPYDFIIFKQPD